MPLPDIEAVRIVWQGDKWGFSGGLCIWLQYRQTRFDFKWFVNCCLITRWVGIAMLNKGVLLSWSTG